MWCTSGMDFYVVLDRPGYRVSRRRRAKKRVGVQHRVTKEDAVKWYELPPPPGPSCPGFRAASFSLVFG